MNLLVKLFWLETNLLESLVSPSNSLLLSTVRAL